GSICRAHDGQGPFSRDPLLPRATRHGEEQTPRNAATDDEPLQSGHGGIASLLWGRRPVAKPPARAVPDPPIPCSSSSRFAAAGGEPARQRTHTIMPMPFFLARPLFPWPRRPRTSIRRSPARDFLPRRRAIAAS